MIEIMDSHFSILADPKRDLIRITVSGFFGLADVERFEADRVSAYAQLRCGPNQHLTLVDVTALSIQPQDVVAAFGRIAGDPRHQSRRLAVVTGASLARQQSRRVTDRATVAYFTDSAEAERWLFAADAAKAA